MRPALRTSLRILPWLLLSVIALYLAFGQGLRDLVQGRMLRAAQETFHKVERVTEARVYLLMGGEGQRTGEVFPVRAYDRTVPVYGSATLTGESLEQLLDLWLYQSVTPAMDPCHDPAYGFRFYRDGELVAETSLCWSCGSFTMDVWPFGGMCYGFDTRGQKARDLLAHCDKLLPHARPPEPPAKENNASAHGETKPAPAEAK